MSAVRWIKLSTDLFNDEKIRYIEQMPESDGILTIWIKLLVLAGQKNMGGEVYFNDEIPYTDEMLSAIFHRKVNLVRLAIETFQKLRMIEVSADRTIIICNWARHQNVDGLDKIRELANDRQKHYRLRQRAIRAAALLENRTGSDVTSNVTPRDVKRSSSVSVTKQKKMEMQKERKKEEVLSPESSDGWTGERQTMFEEHYWHTIEWPRQFYDLPAEVQRDIDHRITAQRRKRAVV